MNLLLVTALLAAEPVDDLHTPYRVTVQLSFAPSPLLPAGRRAELQADLAAMLERTLGPSVTFAFDGDAGQRIPIAIEPIVGGYRFGGSEEATWPELGDAIARHVVKRFALSGTTEGLRGEEAIVRLQGGLLPGVSERVKAGDFFRVERVDDLLLQAIDVPRNGLVRCKPFARYANPLPVRGREPYRVNRIEPMPGPMRLALADTEGKPVPERVRVYYRGNRFPDDHLDADRVVGRAGEYALPKTTGIAFVTIMDGERALARIPLVGAGTHARTVRLEVGPDRPTVTTQTEELLRRINDARILQIQAFAELARKEQAGNNPEALTYGEARAKSFGTLTAECIAERDRLKREAHITAGDAPLAALTARAKELDTHLQGLRDAVRRENDPALVAKRKQLAERLRQADVQLAEADYDGALASYDAAIRLLADDPAGRAPLVERRDRLAARYALKSDAHGPARTFIYAEWPTLGDLERTRQALPFARLAFENCKANDDPLTIAKLHLTAPVVVERYTEAFRAFGMTMPDKARLDDYRNTADELRRLLEDVQTYLAGVPKN